MINLTIDGRMVSVPKGTTVFNAAKQLEVEIPAFCYLDRMPPFGACRICLVEVEKMGKLQASCTLEATEGMVVRTQSSMAVDGRKSIIELLLLNHPLDCPVCDRGGECPLQEHAMNHGPGMSRFYEEKRHFKKPLPLGPVLMLDRERCIVCARCTRFGDLVAGDHALELLDRGFRTEVGTPDGGPAKSKFIGNTIMICPVGALTSQVYRFRARPWDNQPTPTTCTLCPVGCSMFLDSRDGEVMRTRSQENKSINDVWLCDKGWFGYDFSSHPARLTTPLVRRDGKLVEATWTEAFKLIAQQISAAKPQGKLAALGGNPLTLEENYLFQKLMRDVAGVNHVDHRVGMPLFNLEQEGLSPGMEMAIGDTEELSYAFLFGLDITEEFPVVWLRLKQAINKGAKVIFVGHFAPEVAAYFEKTVLHAPGQELQMIQQQTEALALLAKEGKKGALFIGKQYLSMPQRAQILSELSKLKATAPNLTLNLLEGRGNSFGARFAGMRPDLGVANKRIDKPGLDAAKLFEKIAIDGWDYLHIAGTDPAKKIPSKLWDQVRKNLGFMVVQELFLTETARQADLVLPTLSFVEKGGTFINLDGSMQKLLPGKMIPETLYSDGDIFISIAKEFSQTLVVDPSLLKLEKLPISNRSYSGKTSETNQSNTSALRATFAHALFDYGTRMKHNIGLIKLVKEPQIRLHPDDVTKRKLDNGDIIQVSANGNTVFGRLKVDAQVAPGTVVLPLGFEQLPVCELGTNLLNGLAVEIKRMEPTGNSRGMAKLNLI